MKRKIFWTAYWIMNICIILSILSDYGYVFQSDIQLAEKDIKTRMVAIEKAMNIKRDYKLYVKPQLEVSEICWVNLNFGEIAAGCYIHNSEGHKIIVWPDVDDWVLFHELAHLKQWSLQACYDNWQKIEITNYWKRNAKERAAEAVRIYFTDIWYYVEKKCQQKYKQYVEQLIK